MIIYSWTSCKIRAVVVTFKTLICCLVIFSADNLKSIRELGVLVWQWPTRTSIIIEGREVFEKAIDNCILTRHKNLCLTSGIPVCRNICYNTAVNPCVSSVNILQRQLTCVWQYTSPIQSSPWVFNPIDVSAIWCRVCAVYIGISPLFNCLIAWRNFDYLCYNTRIQYYIPQAMQHTLHHGKASNSHSENKTALKTSELHSVNYIVTWQWSPSCFA